MRVAFRVDASSDLGFGHVMRCRTLADALRRGGAETEFLYAEMPPALHDSLVAGGHQLTDIGAFDAVNVAGPPRDWVVFDHYRLEARHETLYRADGARIAVIDDLANRSHDCDLLLDQNFYRAENRYDGLVPSHCRLLLGPRYALLGPAFTEAHATTAPRSGPVRRVLIAFGGVDAPNYTTMVLDAFSQIPKSSRPAIDVVIGAQNPHGKSVEAACRRIEATLHVQTTRMAELLAEADLAVGAGGVSTLERWSLGVPSIVFPIAENQRQLTIDAALEGLVIAPDCEPTALDETTAHLRAALTNSALRSRLSAQSMSLVDARGAQRVVLAMSVPSLRVRRARSEDSEQLWEWRNHPSVRAASLNSREIPRVEHDRWFERVVDDPAHALLIVEQPDGPSGVVRFDMDGTHATISIHRVPDERSAGAGAAILGAAEEWLRLNVPDVECIEAVVREGNATSRRLFGEGGYQMHSRRYIKRIRR